MRDLVTGTFGLRGGEGKGEGVGVRGSTSMGLTKEEDVALGGDSLPIGFTGGGRGTGGGTGVRGSTSMGLTKEEDVALGGDSLPIGFTGGGRGTGGGTGVRGSTPMGLTKEEEVPLSGDSLPIGFTEGGRGTGGGTGVRGSTPMGLTKVEGFSADVLVKLAPHWSQNLSFGAHFLPHSGQIRSERKGAAQFVQNFCSSLHSAPHLGHFIRLNPC